MSLARLQSRAPDGLDAPPVSVEINLSGGLPSFTIALLQRPWLEADPGWPRGKSPLRIMACSFLTS